jgi:cell wall-associated NlpC family hydrolase
MTDVRSLKQGDLVAWGNSPASAHHIAIYAGNGMIWEAPHTGAQVRLRKISPNEAGIMGISLGI